MPNTEPRNHRIEEKQLRIKQQLLQLKILQNRLQLPINLFYKYSLLCITVLYSNKYPITTKQPEANNHVRSGLCIFIISDKLPLSAVLNNILSCLYFSIVFLSLSHHIFQTSHTRPVTALAAAVGFLHPNSFSKCSSSTFAFLRFSGSEILL